MIASNLTKALLLPCGATLKNRLMKSPMSDSLSDGRGEVTAQHVRLYERWAEGGVALSIIGEVQVNSHYPEKPGNLVLKGSHNNPLIHQLISKATINDAHLWAQLGHAGALTHPPINQPLGPSVLQVGDFYCDEMSIEHISALPMQYAKAAVGAKEIGFSGVQIHAGHGFLLSQFLSPLFNHRSDAYGGSIEGCCRLILEIITAVRMAVGSSFPVGIRINSSDKIEDGLNEEGALEIIKILDKTSIDLIDISGGTYFPGKKSCSDTAKIGGYFIDFARRAKALTTIPIVVTGGFKRREQVLKALTDDAIDMVGLGRALALNPNLPNLWSAEGGEEEPVFPRFSTVKDGEITAWYTMLLTALSEDREQDFKLSLQEALQQYEQRDAGRCSIWRRTFLSADG